MLTKDEANEFKRALKDIDHNSTFMSNYMIGACDLQELIDKYTEKPKLSKLNYYRYVDDSTDLVAKINEIIDEVNKLGEGDE